MPTSGADNGLHGGVAGDLTDPQQAMGSGFEPGAEMEPGDEADDEQEELLVKKLWQKYDRARKFDENFRKQIAIDRRYAAGTSDLSWAVTTNLIGCFIDILVALLYARDPDVSVKKSAQVDESNTSQMETFAKTLEIVISRVWRNGKLKKAGKKVVRSVLSNAEGWLKAMMISEKVPQPEVEKALNDAREMMAHLEAQQKLIEDPEGKTPEEIEALIAEKDDLISSLEDKLALAVNKMFVIDYVPTENMQVSTDVACIEDYLEADWIGNEMYIEKEDALSRFPRLKPADLKSAKLYYQREPKETSTRELDNVLPQGMLTAESAQAFTTSSSSPEQIAFVRVVEVWDRTDKKIRTVIDGVKRWAKEPFSPPYPTSRFYPYFYLAFYEVDGQRHAQSLSWRLYKLQDEYSATRSNFRLTRERSIPGVLFNSTMLDGEEARKLSEAKHQEYTGLKPGDPNVPLANLFAPKPVQGIDPRLYDPTYILNDMERISGIQEALSSVVNAPGNPITATQAHLQQMGTNARTATNRDALEEMLTDLGQYTAEQVLQCLTIRDVQRMAGPKAFWPEGMDIEDLHTLVEVTIKAGTTGKPSFATDQQSWATILPLIKQTLLEIKQALGAGDLPLANSLIELVKETMRRLGDESDVERFIPRNPPPGSPGAGAAPQPPPPNISISLRGEIDPATAAALVQPSLQNGAPVPTEVANAPPEPTPGAGPAPAGAENAPSPAAPGPSPGEGLEPLPNTQPPQQ